MGRHVALTMFAGVGLFFVGVNLISSSVAQMTSVRLRGYLRRATNNPVKAAAIGAVGGGLTQSTNAMTLMVTGMIAGGTMTVRQACRSSPSPMSVRRCWSSWRSSTSCRRSCC